MLTKLAIRTAVQQYIDDTGAKRWPTASLDQVISFVYDELWGDILDSNPYWNSQYDQIGLPLHVPGYVDLRLVADGGDLASRFYRLQQCIADGRHYYAKDPRDYLLTASSETGDVTTVTATVEQAYTYQFLGDQLWLHPLGSVSTLVELRYNFTPPSFVNVGDAVQVDFPDGGEHALILLSAAHAMMKGGAEDPAGFMRLGLQAKENLINSIRKRYHGPTIMFGVDDPVSFGGI